MANSIKKKRNPCGLLEFIRHFAKASKWKQVGPKNIVFAQKNTVFFDFAKNGKSGVREKYENTLSFHMFLTKYVKTHCVFLRFGKN